MQGFPEIALLHVTQATFPDVMEKSAACPVGGLDATVEDTKRGGEAGRQKDVGKKLFRFQCFQTLAYRRGESLTAPNTC